MKQSFIYFVLGFSFLIGCKTNLQELPTYSANKQVQAIIQTPAGSNHPQVYDARLKSFVPFLVAGEPDKIKFLPYPANFGFIPSTNYRAGDDKAGKPLEVMVLAESTEAGTVLEIIPIATLVLDKAGELTYIIIAVPARPSEQIINASDFESFTEEFPAAKFIIQQWFLHQNPDKTVRLAGWKDERYTERFIQKWLQ